MDAENNNNIDLAEIEGEEKNEGSQIQNDNIHIDSEQKLSEEVKVLNNLEDEGSNANRENKEENILNGKIYFILNFIIENNHNELSTEKKDLGNENPELASSENIPKVENVSV